MSLSGVAFEAGPGPASRPAVEAIVVVTRPAAVVSPEVALRLGGAGPVTVWDADEGDGRSAFVGFGAAVRVDARGEGRFEDLRARADRVFDGVTEVRAVGADRAPAPRLFGGLAFAPTAARAAPWTGFADASFTMPRALYFTDGVRAFVRLAGPAGSRAAEALQGEAAAFADAVEAAAAAGADDRPRVATGARAEAVSCATDEAEFLARCAELVARIQAGDLVKAALSLHTRVALDRPIDLAAVIGRLGRAYPDCARFAVERDGRVFVGASPERLVSLRGRVVEADALAGTIGRGARPGDDDARAAALLASAKERAEHDLVVRAVCAALARTCVGVEAAVDPRVRTLTNVHHLWTPVRAERGPGGHVLDLVAALHPTPAVGGVPRAEALAWLARSERHDRGWYTGAVGWFDAAGDGAFSVGIRAALCSRDHADLYAGAGIVLGSVPELELAEVRAKLRPMVAALGAGS